MTIRHRAAAALRRIRHRAAAPLRWWAGLSPAERVLYQAMVLLAVGSGLVYLPAVFIVPGLVLLVVFLGTMRRGG